MRSRGALLALISVLCVGGAVGFVVYAAMNGKSTTTDAKPKAVAPPARATGGGKAAALPTGDLMVRAVDPKDPRLNGRVFKVHDGRPEPAGSGKLSCQRVYYAAGHGLCLALGRSGVDYHATIFDSALRPQHEIDLTGLPDRARVSPDGRLGAMTVFVNGHSYASDGSFSTTTTIVDMRTGHRLGELEQFKVLRDGQEISAPDFNFWGVTFTRDSNTIYATLRTGDHYYLLKGDIRAKTFRVLRDHVECPSLSPDGMRIAFKSRIGRKDAWHIRVLDVATLRDHAVAEPRSIDDQVEWLNDTTLVYSDKHDVFTVPADGSGTSERLLRGATSPAALRR